MEDCFYKDNKGEIICLRTYYENECDSYCNESRCDAPGYPPCISCCPCLLPCLLTIDLLLSPCFVYYKYIYKYKYRKKKKQSNISLSI